MPQRIGYAVVGAGDMTRHALLPAFAATTGNSRLAAIVAADAWNIEPKAIADALSTFKSVRRRCEVRGEVNGITVIDDFAHHPTAVRETLVALRLKYKDRRLVAVFEPRSRTSCHATFQYAYVNAFSPAVFNVPRTINLLTALPDVTDALTVPGPGAGLLTVRRDPAAAQFRVFNLGAVATFLPALRTRLAAPLIGPKLEPHPSTRRSAP